MAIYSKNMSFMLSAVGYAAKAITRDFYEINKLQCSHNTEGVQRFSENTYSKSQSVLINFLKDSQPEFGFSKEDEKEYYWQIKPIDGLYNFSRSLPHFAICISLFKGDEMGAIAIALPIFREVFWAEKGLGAYVEDDHGTTKLRLNSNKQFSNHAVIVLSGINGKIFQALQGMQYRITGSTYANMAYVAAGKFDALICAREIFDKSLLIQEAYGSTLATDKYSIFGNNKIASKLIDRLQNEN